MKMRFFYLLICMLAGMSLVVSGCEVDDDADADGGTGGGTDTSTDGTDTDGTDTEEPTLDYRFVRVTDLSNDSGTSDAGADIDAIFITKSGGNDVFPLADKFIYEPSGGEVQAADPNAAIDIDAFTAYPNVDTCELNDASGAPNYVSLGGTGYIIAEFAAPGVEEGDTLKVLEVGGCDFGSGTAREEEVRIEISTGSSLDGTWQTVSTGTNTLHQTTITSAMVPPVALAP